MNVINMHDTLIIPQFQNEVINATSAHYSQKSVKSHLWSRGLLVFFKINSADLIITKTSPLHCLRAAEVRPTSAETRSNQTRPPTTRFRHASRRFETTLAPMAAAS